MGQQAAEQRGVHAGRDRQKQIGVGRGRGAPRIDDDELRAALALGRHHALVKHRMAPRRIRADQHDEVGFVDVAVGAGHDIGAEGAAVAGDRGGHAQARIGVDVGRAEKAFHQLVGDVIVLGEQLAGEIERDRVRPVALQDRAQSAGDFLQRLIPAGANERTVRLPQHRMQQAAIERKRLAQARCPSSTAARNSPDGRDRPRSSRRRGRPAPPARRSRPRNRGTWCARQADEAAGRSCQAADVWLASGGHGLTPRAARPARGRRSGPRGKIRSRRRCE